MKIKLSRFFRQKKTLSFKVFFNLVPRETGGHHINQGLQASNTIRDTSRDTESELLRYAVSV